MGRKIPGKKHHGVRDPEKQKQRRFALIKDKINAPPTNSDEQQVPKSLSRLIDLTSRVKTGAISVRRKRKRAGGKPEPVFRQAKNESDERFMFRVSRACRNVLQEAKFEDKYGVSVRRDASTGEVRVVKRKRDEIEEYHRKVKKELKTKGKKKKKQGEGVGERLTKSQKRSAKTKAKKEKLKDLKLDEFNDYKDRIEFGEVAHAPPSLVVPKKARRSDESQRPGKKDLLLKSLEGCKKIENKVIDKKGKRKDLPAAMRRQLEKQQQEVINAYKLLKAKRHVKE